MSPQRWALLAAVTISIPAAALGVRLAQPVSETQIITRYATLYLQEAGDGARMSDCLGLPGGGAGVRLTVSCAHRDGRTFIYFAGPRGARLFPALPQEPLA